MLIYLVNHRLGFLQRGNQIRNISHIHMRTDRIIDEIIEILILYAISVALKLISVPFFTYSFIFCLMLNIEYLRTESIVKLKFIFISIFLMYNYFVCFSFFFSFHFSFFAYWFFSFLLLFVCLFVLYVDRQHHENRKPKPSSKQHIKMMSLDFWHVGNK